jgi:hypothetical protein
MERRSAVISLIVAVPDAPEQMNLRVNLLVLIRKSPITEQVQKQLLHNVR